MKVAYYKKYGPPEVLSVIDHPTPQPKDDEVRIKIATATVNTGDCELRDTKIPNSIWLMVRLFFGVFKPRKNILGAYFSGEIDIVGREVSEFKPGDKVVVCSGEKFGAYAEFICLKASSAIAKIDTSQNFDEVAPLGLGFDALHFLNLAEVGHSDKILIIGAGGGIGTLAVQLAKNRGAEVTAIDKASKLTMLKEIGAHHTIDYQTQDFGESQKKYTVIFDLIGKGLYNKCINQLEPNGRYILANPDGFLYLFKGLWTTLITNKRVITKFASASPEGMRELVKFHHKKSLQTVIDRSFSLEEIVQAHKFVETGEKIGTALLKIQSR